ncbi:endopeptidase La [Clostridium hydrogeniformans]|uniref:endopeptidase La n=1 Tax=Clostridium hydrogeniformans TaxID=349933 RepID=UPI000482B3EA|nr:endopeptidase La [Clostridium hydrogeniformans]
MKKEEKILPLIPLRGMVIFPNMILHFDVGREKSLMALEEAMINEQKIFLSAQKEARVEEPSQDDIYEIGTICTIKQLLKLPGDTVRVLVEGVERGKIKEILVDDEFYRVKVESVPDVVKEENINYLALTAKLKDTFKEFVGLSGNLPPEILDGLEEIEDNSKLVDTISSYITLKLEMKQDILEAAKLEERIEKLILILKNEIEILKLEKKIDIKVKKKIDKLQKDYFLREQLKVIQEELGEDDEGQKEIKEYKKKITKAKLPKEAKEKALYELNKLKNSGGYSSESSNIKTYLDWLLATPWTRETKDNIHISDAREILNKEHFGLEDVKERIIEYLAVKKISNSLKGPILCLVGPPGVGKTSIAKSVAHAINRNFVRVSLGGVRDEAEIRGHRRTYVGAIPGRIVYGMKEADSSNPVFLLDEIDKMSNDFKGDPAGALLEVLDGEQNKSFRDHYLELDMDLSKVMFIATANTLETIPRPLLDRMEIIEVSGYTYEEKLNISKEHLVKKQLKEHGVEEDKIKFADSSLSFIIECYTRESGVRSLERKIGAVIRKAITELLEKDKTSISITINHVRKYLGKEVFLQERIDKEDKIGVVTGMAWTAYGGDILPVEVSVMKGNGKLELTGQLGDVMKESAKAAYSLVRSRSESYGIDNEFYKNKDIHIHAPEGAIPKDGPSAGITMTTAIISALSNKKVRHNVAMTGEVTLTGRVLPIGGLKEKCLAAYRSGIDTVIIPKNNEKDIDKIPKSLKSKMKFILAAQIDEVIKNALVGDE